MTCEAATADTCSSLKHDESPFGFVSLSLLTEYAISLEADIQEKSQNPEQLFLLALIKDKTEEGKKGGGVQQEATDIFEVPYNNEP